MGRTESALDGARYVCSSLSSHVARRRTAGRWPQVQAANMGAGSACALSQPPPQLGSDGDVAQSPPCQHPPPSTVRACPGGRRRQQLQRQIPTHSRRVYPALRRAMTPAGTPSMRRKAWRPLGCRPVEATAQPGRRCGPTLPRSLLQCGPPAAPTHTRGYTPQPHKDSEDGDAAVHAGTTRRLRCCQLLGRGRTSPGGLPRS